jgi:hypothetical protein
MTENETFHTTPIASHYGCDVGRKDNIPNTQHPVRDATNKNNLTSLRDDCIAMGREAHSRVSLQSCSSYKSYENHGSDKSYENHSSYNNK